MLVITALALCSCRPQYYFPGGRVKRSGDCGCPSFSQVVPLHKPLDGFQSLHPYQTVYAQTLPVAEAAHLDEGR